VVSGEILLRWYVRPAVYWYMENNNAVAFAAVLGMYRDGELVGVSFLSFHVEGWEKRRCLASDAAIRARVE
jgi:hypothetical protein